MRFLVTASKEYYPLAKMCIESIRKHHKEDIILLTNVNYYAMIGEDAIIYEPWTTGPECMTARYRVLARMDDEPLISLGADTLVRRPLHDVFDDPFKLGLTWRNKAGFRYNTDVTFNRGAGEFWNAVLERSKGHRHEHNFARMEFIIDEEVSTGRWEGYLKEFPCSVWNYTPASFKDSVDDARILHFKGAKKAHMADYCKQQAWQ